MQKCEEGAEMTKNRIECPGKTYKRVFIKEMYGDRWYSNCEMNEDDYMNLSSVWQSIRQKKLRKNPICEICHSGINVQVHHLHYPNVWGEESLEDLMTVCDKCHEDIHKEDIERRKQYVTNS